jgi:acyl-CoA synthetase (AMP-forming)/AMP-acid ligase II
MNTFLADLNTHKTWDDLINEINSTAVYNSYCNHTQYYDIFKHIIISMLCQQKIILADNMGYANSNDIISINSLQIKDKDDLINKLQQTSDQWSITLQTSGTSGRPKEIVHTFKTLTKNIHISTKFQSCIWGFAYNPVHMAGLQVFLQAALNGNSIIRLFDLNVNVICELIELNKITHISATPTFYRLLSSCNVIFNYVNQITVGGERIDEYTIKKIHNIFPSAKFTNIYALTEAGALLTSNNDIFTIPEKYADLIKLQDNEILLHNSIVGNSTQIETEWYATGDLVEIISEQPLQFYIKTRLHDEINVGGYKVNPNEIEDNIRNISGVIDACVYSKKNKLIGNIICCDIVLDNTNVLTVYDIRNELNNTLQSFKIPRIINFVLELSTSKNGKIKRDI